MASLNYRLLKRHFFVFNPEDSEDEGLTLMTEYFSNGALDGFSATHEFSLQSGEKAVSFLLIGVEITPEKLRALADELEKARKQAIDMAQVMIDKTH